METSLIVATKDRGPDISKTLDSLLDVDYAQDEYEIVLVDNRSAPENTQYLVDYQRTHPDRVRYVYERKIGLSNARNAGIAHSDAKFLVFTDDDVVVPRHWLKNLVRALKEDAAIYVVGGRVVSSFTTPAPDWLDKRLLMYLSDFDKGEDVLPLKYNEYPRGVNMAFRREAFEECGLFLDCFGRKGDSLMSYEEIELCYRIEKAGHRILYVPGAELNHLIRGDRLNMEWFRNRFYWQGKSEGLFELLHFGRPFILKALPFRIAHAIRGDVLERSFLAGFMASFLAHFLRTKFS